MKVSNAQAPIFLKKESIFIFPTYYQYTIYGHKELLVHISILFFFFWFFFQFPSLFLIFQFFPLMIFLLGLITPFLG